MPETRELIADWLIRFRPGTRDGYRRDLDQFTKWLEKDPLVATRGEIQRWINHLTEATRLADTTVRRKASSVTSFLDYALSERAIDHNPAKDTKRPKGDTTRRKGLDLVQAQALLAAAEQHSKSATALIWLFIGNGLRASEACSAEISDLDGDLLTTNVKGGGRHLQPLEPQVLTAVRAAIGDRTEGRIIRNRDSRPLTRGTSWALVKKLAANAGIKNLTQHELRNSAAAIGLAAGASIEDVQQLLGHKDIRTTERYIRNRDLTQSARKAAHHVANALKPGGES